jgi:hypothetical protein
MSRQPLPPSVRHGRQPTSPDPRKGLEALTRLETQIGNPTESLGEATREPMEGEEQRELRLCSEVSQISFVHLVQERLPLHPSLHE